MVPILDSQLYRKRPSGDVEQAVPTCPGMNREERQAMDEAGSDRSGISRPLEFCLRSRTTVWTPSGSICVGLGLVFRLLRLLERLVWFS